MDCDNTLKTAPAKKVKAHIISDCIVNIECKVWKTVDAGECFTFFGKILSAYADTRYFKKGLWTEKAEIPFHLGGPKMVYFK